MRLAIESELRGGADPKELSHLRHLSPVTDPKRFLNVVRQEKRLIDGGRKPFKCNCGVPPPADYDERIALTPTGYYAEP
jgi:hypothetical protein